MLSHRVASLAKWTVWSPILLGPGPPMLSLVGEKHGLGLGGLETDGVVVGPPQAGGCASLQALDCFVDAVSLYYPSDAIREGNTSAALDLVGEPCGIRS